MPIRVRHTCSRSWHSICWLTRSCTAYTCKHTCHTLHSSLSPLLWCDGGTRERASAWKNAHARVFASTDARMRTVGVICVRKHPSDALFFVFCFLLPASVCLGCMCCKRVSETQAVRKSIVSVPVCARARLCVCVRLCGFEPAPAAGDGWQIHEALLFRAADQGLRVSPSQAEGGGMEG